MRPITRFDEQNLVLVGVVEWLGIIHSNREVERSGVDLCDCRELRDTRVLPGDQLCPSESELCIGLVASGDKDRAIIDRNSNNIFGIAGSAVPERRGEKCVVDELGILSLAQ